MSFTIGGVAPWLVTGAGAPAVFDVLLRVEVGPPVVHHGAADFRCRIGGLDGSRVRDSVVGDFVVGEGTGVHVAVHGVPPGRLVVEIVDSDAASGRGAEFADEVSDPCARPGRVNRCTGRRGRNTSYVAARCIRAAVDATGVESVSA